MSEQQMSAKELRLVIRLLDKLRDTANHITLTGGLQGGEQYLQQQFDLIMTSLAEQGIALPRYFPPLPPDANTGMLGVAADQLAEYLKELMGPEEGDAGKSGTFFDRFFGSGDFAHIGEAMREAMPDWMRTARERREGGEVGGSPSAELERRLTEVSTRLQAVAAQMRQEGLSPEEAQRLAAEMSALAQEQARISQEVAAGRAPGAGH
jgi:hypothetical protein